MQSTVYFIPETLKTSKQKERIYLTHIGYYPKTLPYNQARKENPNYVFLYCEEGSGMIEYSNKKYLLSPNQAFMFPAKSANVFEPIFNNPWSVYCFHFNGENCNKFSGITGKILSISNFKIDILKEMCLIVERDYDFVNISLEYFLCSFQQFVYQEDVNLIQQSIEYMKNAVENKKTLDDVSSHVSCSSAKLNVLFKKNISCSPMEYYNRLKIQRACYYLQLSNFGIKEIAFKLGFYDLFHFSNTFKKEMGISPKDFRKQYNINTLTDLMTF